MRSPVRRLRFVAFTSVLLAWLLPVRVLAQWVEKVNWVTDHLVAFPHVAAGPSGGAYAETTILLTNPSQGEVTIELGASITLAAFEQSVRLQPFESREIQVRTDTYTAGWIIAAAPAPFGADAHVVIKTSRDSPEVLARIALPAQTPVSKLVFPVKLGSAFAENTAFALSVHRFLTSEFRIRFRLFDSSSTLVADTERAWQLYTAKYVTELFPDLPKQFSGFMVIDLVGPRAQPMAFTAVAVYTAADLVFSGETTGVDEPGIYGVFLKGPGDSELESLSQQYGLTGVVHSSGSLFFTAKMTRQVAGVLARDPRIEILAVPAELVPAGSP